MCGVVVSPIGNEEVGKLLMECLVGCLVGIASASVLHLHSLSFSPCTVPSLGHGSAPTSVNNPFKHLPVVVPTVELLLDVLLPSEGDKIPHLHDCSVLCLELGTRGGQDGLCHGVWQCSRSLVSVGG